MQLHASQRTQQPFQLREDKVLVLLLYNVQMSPGLCYVRHGLAFSRRVGGTRRDSEFGL